MESRVRLSCLLVVVASGMTACYSGGSTEPTFNLEFDAPDASGLANTDVDREFAPVVTQDVELPAATAVTGQVTDGTGAPMQNVGVSFHRTSTSPGLDETTTDASGNYSVDVPTGTWVVRLESQDDSLGTRTVTGVTVTTATTIDFRFSVPISAPGVVYESDGTTPMVGAGLEFTGATTGATASVTTDALGEYTVALVPDTYEIIITPNGAAALTHLRQRFTVNVNGARVLSFVLTRGIQVSGTVRRFLGTPLLDTDIEIELTVGSPFFPPADVKSSDVDGTYSIDLMPPGTVRFELQPPGDTGFPRQLIILDIVGPTTQNEDLALAPAYVLRGTILQDDGVTPEANVAVRAVPIDGSLPPDDDDDSDVTDAAGQFAISLFSGFWDILVIPDPTKQLAPEIRSFPVMKDLVLNVTLKRGVMLTGTVTDPGGATPLPDIRVEIPEVPETFSITDDAGSYSVLAPVGTHTLELTAEDGPFQGIVLDPAANVVVAAPGPVTEDITISVATTGSRVVEGTVYATDGVTPVEGTAVTATDNQTGEVIGVATTDANGDYVMVLVE